MARFLKLLVAAVVLVALYQYGVPWFKEHFQSSGSAAPSSASGRSDSGDSGGDGGSCIQYAERASDVWSGGLGRFVNPPYDQMAWSEFRSDVDSRISSARSACSCGDESCTKARAAMDELSSIVSQVDGAIRGGQPPPFDLVQRQQSVDDTLNAAHDLVRAGK